MRKLKQKSVVAPMRKFCLGSCFTVLFMALCISACSDDDDDAEKSVFPEKQTVSCVPNDVKELNFETNADWQLTSSATWCRLMNDDHEDYSLSGTAGKQTVILKITDEAMSFDVPTVARLTMMIGANKAIVADVVRDSKVRELKIYDMEGNEIHEIEVGYDDYKPFQIKANFRFAATNRPEWLDIAGNAIVGNVNEMTKGEVKVVDNSQYAKYAQNGTLTFVDEDGVMPYSFPLVYKGMNPKSIKILDSNPWNWEVSLDGKTFTQTSSAGTGTSTTSTYNKFIPYTVQALNDKVVPVYIQKVIEYGMTQMKIGAEDGVEWMKLEDDEKGNLRLKVDKSSEEREGYVLLLPQALYDEIKEDLWENLIETDMGTYEQDIKYTYQQSNLLIIFVQKEKKQEAAQAFKVTYFDSSTSSMKEAVCTKVTNSDITDSYPEISEIYTVEYPSASIEIDPLLGDFETDWNIKVKRNGEDITSEGICEGGASSTSISAWEEEVTEEFHILFEKDGETKKVLIVTPNYN